MNQISKSFKNTHIIKWQIIFKYKLQIDTDIKFQLFSTRILGISQLRGCYSAIKSFKREL